MLLSEVRDILKAEVLFGDDMLDNNIFGAGGADLMDDILSAVTKGAALLTGLISDQVLRTAKIAEVGAVVFVRGKKPNKELLELARSYNLPILSTEYSLFVASGRLYMNGLRGLDGSW